MVFISFNKKGVRILLNSTSGHNNYMGNQVHSSTFGGSSKEVLTSVKKRLYKKETITID